MSPDRHIRGKHDKLGVKLLLFGAAILLAGVVYLVGTPKTASGFVPKLELVRYHPMASTNGFITSASLRLKNDTGGTITLLGNPKRVSVFLGQLGERQRFMMQFPKNVVLHAGEEYVFDVSVWDASTPWVASVEYVEGSHPGVRKGFARILPVSLEQKIWKREISQRSLMAAYIPAAN